jgi:CRP/FNR family cyclic AMP-dependent transcriptional regulator
MMTAHAAFFRERIASAGHMPPKRTAKPRLVIPPKQPEPFDVQEFLDSAGAARKIATYRRSATIYSQGDPCATVMYLQHGRVKLSVLSHAGKEAVVAVLGPGDFFGEGALADQPVRIGTATAMMESTVLVIEKHEMIRVLREQHAFSDRFIAHMLARNIRVEADLVDQLFNSSEKRLARALLLLARYSKDDGHERVIPKVSQETLAEMVGTTRSRQLFHEQVQEARVHRLQRRHHHS